jgi:hypothetical protein
MIGAQDEEINFAIIWGHPNRKFKIETLSQKHVISKMMMMAKAGIFHKLHPDVMFNNSNTR